jgi:iodotyrosine deiodinase
MSKQIFKDGHPFVQYQPAVIPVEQGIEAGQQFYENLNHRRSVRLFSSRAVPKQMIKQAILCASTAPSGAHRQPWKFVAISDPTVKKQIRIAAEQEEQQNYATRMPEEWKKALAPLGTDANKSYLETVPWIVVVFAENYGIKNGQRQKNYYVKESVGIACGLFIASLHQMGLCTLTHTPSPMRFLSTILNRPSNEQPYILFPIGYPAADCIVPDIQRKTLSSISEWIESQSGN